MQHSHAGNHQGLENRIIHPDAPAAMQKMSCGEQCATGFSYLITKARERRYPIVDEERGLVLAFVFLDHSGAFPEFKMTDGKPMKLIPPFDASYSYIMTEVFRIKDRKILQVEAVLLEVPYGMPSGWVDPDSPHGAIQFLK